MTITPLPGDKPPAAGDHPVTITDPATVARIAAVVNGLPVEPAAGFMECGPTNGTGMRLTFRTTAGGPALAVASGYQTLCGMVSLVVDGKQTPDLSGGELMFQRVMTIAGFHWSDFPVPAPDNVPTTPPPAPAMRSTASTEPS